MIKVKAFGNLFSIGILCHLFHPVSPFPIDTPPLTEAASTHNIYLLTCTSSSKRQDASGNVTAIAFYNTPISSTPSSPRDHDNVPKPDQSAIISAPAANWEGVAQNVPVWNNTIFTSNITVTASPLAKGQIAGDAVLGTEEFACFEDGATEIVLSESNGDGDTDKDGKGKGRGKEKTDCTANYWCASIG